MEYTAFLTSKLSAAQICQGFLCSQAITFLCYFGGGEGDGEQKGVMALLELLP